MLGAVKINVNSAYLLMPRIKPSLMQSHGDTFHYNQCLMSNPVRERGRETDRQTETETERVSECVCVGGGGGGGYVCVNWNLYCLNTCVKE